ncbi:MAG TPA: sigma factor-like helix-turn-helix DNA-binding protein [Gemmataceae bacterium]|nr:sigma factor-like helix-turn-helix DNA-binding protein [Gemmataceae bacterium]
MAPPATVPDWLAADRPWLSEQPGMTPWPAAAARVVARLAGWVERYTAELGVANPGCGCAPRLWACWSHHWRTAVEKARQPVDGAEVAAQIEASRGYRRNGHLGGNVILDVVLAAAMLRKDDTAIRRFEASYKDSIVRQVVSVRRFAHEDPAWWNDLLAELVGVHRADREGRLTRYSGQSGLIPWTVTVAVRFLADRLASRPRGAELDLGLPDPALGRAGAVREAISADCLDLLAGRIRDALNALRSRERLALRLSVVDGKQGQQIATVFRINPGNVSRLLQGAREAIWRHMSADVSRADENRECFDALIEGGADKNLADALRAALESVGREGQP